ncbi:MAG: Sir2 family NAD-dependent protein deacetylase, partial [Steroidobacteraceae bacterium]
AADAPDGDADLDGRDFSAFEDPHCTACDGVLKPDVVFFGENVPPERVEAAMRGLAHADALLVVGSSLMVYSGYRFATAAARAGKPIAVVNLGRTRADDLIALKVEQSCAAALAALTGVEEIEDPRHVTGELGANPCHRAAGPSLSSPLERSARRSP